MFRIPRLALAGIAAFSAAVQAQNAEPNWFELEVVVFERGAIQPLREQFTDKVALPKTNHAVDLITPLYSRDLTSVLTAIRRCPVPAATSAELDALQQSFSNIPALPFTPTAAQQAQALQQQADVENELTSQLSSGPQPAVDQTTQAIPADEPSTAVEEPTLADLELAAISAQLQQSAELLTAVAPTGQYPLLTDCRLTPTPAPLTFAADVVKEYSPAPDVLAATPIVSGQHSPVSYLADASAQQLKDLVWQLSNRSGHKILLHTVVRSALQPKRQSLPWRLIGGKRFSPDYDSLGLPVQQSDVTQDSLTNAINHTFDYLQRGGDLSQLNRQAPSVDHVWQLDGTVLAYNDRILSADVQLLLRQQVQAQQPLVLYRFNQSTRLLLGEIHYLDHPKFGVILQIRRFTPPQTQPTL